MQGCKKAQARDQPCKRKVPAALARRTMFAVGESSSAEATDLQSTQSIL